MSDHQAVLDVDAALRTYGMRVAHSKRAREASTAEETPPSSARSSGARKKKKKKKT